MAAATSEPAALPLQQRELIVIAGHGVLSLNRNPPAILYCNGESPLFPGKYSVNTYTNGRFTTARLDNLRFNGVKSPKELL